MVYCDSLVVSVIHNGKVVLDSKENGEFIVRLPFKADYSLQFKNCRRQKCVISELRVDGTDVLSGLMLVVPPHDKLVLEGFMDRDAVVRNKFRFIQLTEKIKQHRGQKAEDGLIEVVFRFEQVFIQEFQKYTFPKIQPPVKPTFPRWPDTDWQPLWTYEPSTTCTTTDGHKEDYHQNPIICQSDVYGPALNSVYRSVSMDEGITVPGKETHQDFQATQVSELGSEYRITIHLKGEQNPRYSRAKITCPTCGLRSSVASKFCSACGTFLQKNH